MRASLCKAAANANIADYKTAPCWMGESVRSKHCGYSDCRPTRSQPGDLYIGREKLSKKAKITEHQEQPTEGSRSNKETLRL